MDFNQLVKIIESQEQERIAEHHNKEWPEAVLNKPLTKLLDDIKKMGQDDLYEKIEDFIETHYVKETEESN